jgi:hypothetical protein
MTDDDPLNNNKNHRWDPNRFQIVSTILGDIELSEHHGRA